MKFRLTLAAIARVLSIVASDFGRTTTALVGVWKPAAVGIALVGAAMAVTAQQADTAGTMMEAARKMDVVDGDLNGAIRQYQAVIDANRQDRVITADALVRMAGAHEKLGHAEARKIYERLIREYADQTESATTARTRLAALTRPGAPTNTSGVVVRQVWTGPKVNAVGSVSPDGRYLSFVDRGTGDLALHDLANGTDRRLTDKALGFESAVYAYSPVISPDGRQVAYSWISSPRRDLRVIGLNGSGPATPRILYDNEDVTGIRPEDWSPDGKWIAVQLRRKDETRQIGLVSATDGSLRMLKSVDWRGATKVFFSPDGQYLAFDLPSGDDSEQRDVFVLAADGSREIPAVVHPANDLAMGWAPDGKHLLFASDRTRAMGVWALPFRDGEPQGAPELVKSDSGRPRALGITRSGALYFGVGTEGSDVYIGSLDFTSGKVLTPPVRPIQQFIGSNSQPDWSPDGKYLAYRTLRDPLGITNSLAVRSVETGQTRELRLDFFSQWNWPRWAPDGRSIMVQGRDAKGRQGAYRIDAQTGEVSLLMQSPPGEVAYTPQWAPDGKRIFYRGTDSARKEEMIIERDLTSGKERELLRTRKVLSGLGTARDGRYVACTMFDQATKELTLLAIPVAGGEPLELLRLQEPQRLGVVTAWTPDSRSILILKLFDTEDREYWLVPLAGGQPRKVDLHVPFPGSSLSVHPDGSHVVFNAGGNKAEVWALENFLPALKPAQK